MGEKIGGGSNNNNNNLRIMSNTDRAAFLFKHTYTLNTDGPQS